jgi:aryl-alcohol dehydrogenase-like predicted oxidoreductase
LGERINDVVVATKVGWFPGTAEHAFHPFHIRRQCEQSLINLKREHIDLYYFHHANFGENDEYLDDAVAEMNKLKDEGKIRAIGQSAYSHEDFVKLVPKVKPDALQSWASALDDRFLDESHPTGKLLKENNIGFFAFRPVEKGLLLHKYKAANPPTFEDGDHRKNNKWFTKESLEKLEAKLAKAEERFGDSTEDLVRMALQYLLHYETITAVIPGFRNLSQVKSNLTAADKPLTDEDFAFVKELFADWE